MTLFFSPNNTDLEPGLRVSLFSWPFLLSLLATLLFCGADKTNDVFWTVENSSHYLFDINASHLIMINEKISAHSQYKRNVKKWLKTSLLKVSWLVLGTLLTKAYPKKIGCIYQQSNCYIGKKKSTVILVL
jgi:hypothetical protein